MALILGLWDGHDSGAALLRDDEVIAAVNEERFTRRKLEVQFPYHSIRACLSAARVNPREVDTIAVATSDLSKSLSRVWPSLKERHYLLRRRKTAPMFLSLQKKAKFLLTSVGPSWLTRRISEHVLLKIVRQLGFAEFKFFLLDHHAAHAACAAYCAPFQSSTVLTVDGVGDGLSATINTYDQGSLTRIAEISARDSLGVFFEQVTYLLNMRELEDEGKVMALSQFAHPNTANVLTDFFQVDGLTIKAKYSPVSMFEKLESFAWKLPWEVFAQMAQQTLREKMVQLFQNALQTTQIQNVAWGGGVAANIKINQEIRQFPTVKNWFVFPHMGDGGLALGAALWARAEQGNTGLVSFPHAYWGSAFSEDEMRKCFEEKNVSFRFFEDIEEKVADLLALGNIVLWFQGRMEYGPRALGNRSILAPADDASAKDLLNRVLKRRSWFQPFCPTILGEDASELLDDFDGLPSPFMTMAYQAKPDKADLLAAVTAPDGSCRPQLLGDENPMFRNLLSAYKKRKGKGVLLNTSFNRHGEPLVASPSEALEVLLEAGFPYLAMGHYLVKAHDK